MGAPLPIFKTPDELTVVIAEAPTQHVRAGVWVGVIVAVRLRVVERLSRAPVARRMWVPSESLGQAIVAPTFHKPSLRWGHCAIVWTATRLGPCIAPYVLVGTLRSPHALQFCLILTAPERPLKMPEPTLHGGCSSASCKTRCFSHGRVADLLGPAGSWRRHSGGGFDGGREVW